MFGGSCANGVQFPDDLIDPGQVRGLFWVCPVRIR